MAAQKQIEFLARALVNRLEDRGIVEFGDAEEGIQLVLVDVADAELSSVNPASGTRSWVLAPASAQRG